MAEIHTAIACWPGATNWPAAAKPPELAVSAVNAVSGPGELNGTCCQLPLPFTESSAIGTVPAGVVARPSATSPSR